MTHNDHWWSWIQLCCFLRVLHNLKYNCAFSVSIWATFAFFSTCHTVISETPCKHNYNADRGPVLPDRDQAPSYLPFHTPQEKSCSFLTLWNWAMPTSSSLSPRPEFFHQFWLLSSAVNVAAAHRASAIETKPLGSGDCMKWGDTALLLYNRYAWKNFFLPLISVFHF